MHDPKILHQCSKRVKTKILHQCSKRVKTKSQEILSVIFYVCRSFRGKTGRSFLATVPSWIRLRAICLLKWILFSYRSKLLKYSNRLDKFSDLVFSSVIMGGFTYILEFQNFSSPDHLHFCWCFNLSY